MIAVEAIGVQPPRSRTFSRSDAVAVDAHDLAVSQLSQQAAFGRAISYKDRDVSPLVTDVVELENENISLTTVCADPAAQIVGDRVARLIATAGT